MLRQESMQPKESGSEKMADKMIELPAWVLTAIARVLGKLHPAAAEKLASSLDQARGREAAADNRYEERWDALISSGEKTE